jgi:D-methionine transport system ATP-binding protein
LVELTFQGSGAAQPFLSILTRKLGVDLGIVQAKVDHISGKPFGTLVVTVPPANVAGLLATAQELGLNAEVLGYA